MRTRRFDNPTPSGSTQEPPSPWKHVFCLLISYSKVFVKPLLGHPALLPSASQCAVNKAPGIQLQSLRRRNSSPGFFRRALLLQEPLQPKLASTSAFTAPNLPRAQTCFLFFSFLGWIWGQLMGDRCEQS